MIPTKNTGFDINYTSVKRYLHSSDVMRPLNNFCSFSNRNGNNICQSSRRQKLCLGSSCKQSQQFFLKKNISKMSTNICHKFTNIKQIFRTAANRSSVTELGSVPCKQSHISLLLHPQFHLTAKLKLLSSAQ